MAFFLFLDESGQDHRNSPYEVLAGIAIEDKDLWNLIRAVQESEVRLFGVRYSSGQRELKATKILKRKTFRLAEQLPSIGASERAQLAAACLQQGDKAGRRELTALAQAKLEYVRELLTLCARFRCKVFASIATGKMQSDDTPDLLRKDYVYLFERFYYFLEDRIGSDASGIIVFDELDRSQSHILLDQMDSYFKKTQKGQQRSSLIIPEPFFVHSDLTTGVQLADMMAYLISWGMRFGELKAPARPELQEFIEQIKPLRYRTIKDVEGKGAIEIWSVIPVRP